MLFNRTMTQNTPPGCVRAICQEVPRHSTLDMLLLLSQQWMEVLNAGHEIRAISRDILLWGRVSAASMTTRWSRRVGSTEHPESRSCFSENSERHGSLTGPWSPILRRREVGSTCLTPIYLSTHAVQLPGKPHPQPILSDPSRG